MSGTPEDPTATTDQLRAAEKRRAAAEVADADLAAYRKQAEGDDQPARTQPPKGRTTPKRAKA